MKQNLWILAIGAFVLALLVMARLKFGHGADTAIASFSLTSAVIFVIYYIQTLARKAERNKRS